MNKDLTIKQKITLTALSIGMFLISLAISYAYFSARIIGNESESTIVGTAAYLELTFTDGEKQINASNILPGWSESKTFKVENTGENTAYYVIRISDITNPYIYGSISYDIVGDNNVTIEKDTLPLMEMPVSSVIEIPVNTTHNYTITTYYNNLEESQKQDLGKSFSYTVSIEAVYKKEINYIEDLVDLSNEVNAGNNYAKTWFLQTRDLDFNSNDSYKNANNMSYGDINGNGTVENIKTELTTGSGFIPIGNYTNSHELYFRGSYDGQNHRIDNLYEYNVIINKQNPGLFGNIRNCTIRNLTVNGNISNYSTNRDVGGIIGYVYNGVIYNLTNEINIYSDFASSSVGGISGSVNNAYIKNCINKGSIENGNNTGGITGYNGLSLIIENSHNQGIISKSKGSFAGGLLGRDNADTNSTTIVNSSNKGKVEIINNDSDSSNIYTGGLVGNIKGTIIVNHSINEANITIITSGGKSINLGGLVGNIVYSGKITNSYNTGDVTGGNRTSGILGGTDSGSNILIDKSYNAGSVSSDYTASGKATIIGGIVGYNNSNNAVVLNSYNIGNLESSSSFACGIVGRVTGNNTYILNSYNAGKIGGHFAVGIVQVNSTNSNVNINNVFNSGIINGQDFSIQIVSHGNNATSNLINTYHENTAGITMSSTAFVNELNQNKRTIDLSTIYNGALAEYADYELSDWKYDSEKGYPILDN